MSKVLKAEILKLRKNKTVVYFTIIVFFLVMLIYLWEAYFTNSNIRQVSLQNATNAGAYGMVIFTTIFRKLWGVLFGFLIVNVELIEHRSDFFIQNTSRRKMWTAKLMIGGMVSAMMSILAYLIPLLVSAIISGYFKCEVSFISIFVQILTVCLITLGNILLGMLASLVINDIIIVGILVCTLDFFPNLYPKPITDIWDRIDGYYYISYYLKPIKEQLKDLKYFIFSISDKYSGFTGLIIWILILIVTIGFSYYLFEKREF